MSSITIANAASNALPTVDFRPHGRGHGKKSSDMESQSESAIGSPGQMPAGASQPLLNSMLQSLQQVVAQATGISSPTGTTAPSTGIASAAGGAGKYQTTGLQLPNLSGSRVNARV